MNARKTKRISRHRRIRAKIQGTEHRPRLSIFRSNQRLSAQLIDDTVGKTIIGIHTTGKSVSDGTKLGEDIAKKAVEKKITHIVFDRGGFSYHGSIKAIAEAARAGGLKF